VRALGIDPGTLHLGWGVVERRQNKLVHVAHGVIDQKAGSPLASRLEGIADALDLVIREHVPSVGSVETLFFHKDAQAAAKLGHARGVVLLCLERAGVAIAEYPPARVKQTVVGNGRAEKRQVAQMVRAVLSLEEIPKLDASDALALAITHLRIGDMAARLAAPSRSLPPQLLAALKGRRRSRG
jgi:crossover junction endodeoxyribonuclease RuvC